MIIEPFIFSASSYIGLLRFRIEISDRQEIRLAHNNSPLGHNGFSYHLLISNWSGLLWKE